MKESLLFKKITNSIFFSVMLYGIFGVLWIKLSDAILLLFIQDSAILSQIQTYKGWFFILVTSFLLYLFIKKHKNISVKQAKEHENIILNVPLPLVEITKSGDIIMVNQAFTKSYGYTQEDIPNGETWFEKVYPDLGYRTMVKRAWELEFSPVQESEYISRIFIIKDAWGKERTVEFLVLKKKESSLVICKDVSQQKIMEEEKIQENKMRALGELAGGIAHDFNNQLTGIMGFTDLLIQSIDRDSPEYEYLESILSATETSATLTSELLAYTRNRTGENEPVPMESIINEIEILAQRTFPLQYKFRKKIDVQNLTVMGNSSRLQSMLLNLVLNAKDAMPQGGDIFIHAYHENRPVEQINGLTLLGGQYLIVEISDQGIGISPFQLNRIFEPLYTTKEKGHGTGMGLAMVYSTLRAHGGSIEVESRLGEGALFRIYLPLGKLES